MGRRSARRRGRFRVTAAVAAALMLLSACSAPTDPDTGPDLELPPFEPIAVTGMEGCAGLERPADAEDGDRLPELELPCFNERRRVDVSQLGGPVVVNLWASWCGPCRKEMPMLADAARSSPEVGFLGINTQDSPEAAADFLMRTGVAYPQLVDAEALVLADTRVPGLPVTLAVDAQGRIVDRVIGEVSEEELSGLLTSLAEQE